MNLKDDALPIGFGLKWKDGRGKTATIDPNTPLAVSSSDENLIKVVNGDDGKPKLAVGALEGVDADENGVIGTATITAIGDGDTGEGVRQVTAVGAITVVAGDAQVGEIEFEQPAAPATV